MNTNQKTTLERQIEACGILDCLSQLEYQMTFYAKSEQIEPHRYEVKHELAKLNVLVNALNEQLTLIKEESRNWEAP